MTDYKDTLNLPKTAFEMRAGLAKKEPKIIDRWQREHLYQRIQKWRAKAPLFVLHDGPPYANGHLHHGHMLNKILKDIVVKDRTMAGFRAPYTPGWDCHGLPIEVQVDKELGTDKASMSKIAVRDACARYARNYIDIQREEFRRLGVMTDWDKIYATLEVGYEGEVVRQLSMFVEGDLLYRGLRPVNWCTEHRTALAEAEVEYEDHSSPSIYVAMALTKMPAHFDTPLNDADLVIWTTTPWTLPANLAIAVHPDHEYVGYLVGGRVRIVARARLTAFLAAIGEDGPVGANIIGSMQGRDLEGLHYHHPLFDRQGQVVLGTHVTMETGTGCVHTAPGHGADDFEVGRRYNLDILSPVDAGGVFTEQAGELAGLHVFDANPKIVAKLVEKGVLLSKPNDTVMHRYAHCWRCHKPIILRATEQWFVAMDKPFARGGTLRERALAALDEVTWVPPWGKDRMRGMLQARPDWCLSRQRSWGIPIPIIYCEKCGTPMMDPVRMRHVGDVFSVRGSNSWFLLSIKDIYGEIECSKCEGTEFRKDTDILDVWFESGMSWSAVLDLKEAGHREGPPADLYLEGSDQHRGWFHSSLLCGLASKERIPFRTVITHGFIVDGEGKKVSKSKGNFVDPFRTINESGAEVLRLWVAGEDYRDDIRISPEIMSRVGDTYRKLRNTIRYLLGNLFDFDPRTDAVTADAMERLDLYALSRFSRASERAQRAYGLYDFHIVVQTLTEICTVDLSAFYLDVLKDRLYASAPKSQARRSAQTAIYLMTRDLLLLAAPILAFTAEEAWEQLPKLDGDADSVHLTAYPGIGEKHWLPDLRGAVHAQAAELEKHYAGPMEARKVVLAALEQARKNKDIGSSTEARVVLIAPSDLLASLRRCGEAELADLCIVSALELREGNELRAEVGRASGTKCGRCWLYREDVGHNAEHPEVCGRCAEVL